VQGAHQNLVVHPNLKPDNILVDAEGSPKLMDFGIAKLLGSEDGPQLPVSAGGLQLLTPDYARPEHVLGQPITLNLRAKRVAGKEASTPFLRLAYVQTARNSIASSHIGSSTSTNS
jgi:serine/threonine protein kinase